MRARDTREFLGSSSIIKAGRTARGHFPLRNQTVNITKNQVQRCIQLDDALLNPEQVKILKRSSKGQKGLFKG